MQGFMEEKKLYKWEQIRRRGKAAYIGSRTAIFIVVYLFVTVMVNKGISNISTNEIFNLVLFSVLVGVINLVNWKRDEGVFLQTIKLAKYKKKFNQDGTLK